MGVAIAPKILLLTRSPCRCRRRNSIAKASRCGLSNTVKKAPPRANSKAPASFTALMKNIGTGIKPPRITMSIARLRSTPLNNR
jgi:hypothetical protein